MLQRGKKRRNMKHERHRKVTAISNPVDLLSIIDDDDELADGEMMSMTAPDGFQLHSDVSSAGPGRVASEPGDTCLVRLGLGWFGGVITRKAEEAEQAWVWLPCDP